MKNLFFILAAATMFLNIAYLILRATRSAEMRQLKEYKMFWNAFLQDIPGGLHRCVVDGTPHVEYVSDRFTQMTGYTFLDIRDNFEGKYTGLCYDEADKEIFRSALRKVSVKDTQENIVYRIRNKAGAMIWVSECLLGTTDSKGKRHVLAVAMDITEKIQEADKHKMEAERYEYILKRLDEIVFEIDEKTGELTYTDNSHRIYNLDKNATNIYRDEKDILAVFHPEDRSFVKEMIYDAMRTGEIYKKEVRLMKNDSQYCWNAIQITGIQDMNGKTKKVVGVLKNIDQEYNEKMQLIEISQRDGLTQLYNRGAFEKYAREYLEKFPKETASFLMIDLDEFKQVNDKYGHLAGDEILKETARFLEKSVDGYESCVGRIGGDEFIILIKNMKEEALRELIRKMYADFIIPLEGHNVSYTGSIGGYSDLCENCSFKKFYACADQQLYSEKERRKKAG